jgi:hypothetical protein
MAPRPSSNGYRWMRTPAPARAYSRSATDAEAKPTPPGKTNPEKPGSVPATRSGLGDDVNDEAAKALRAPFPEKLIGKLPRVTCKACSDKSSRCEKHSKTKCQTCGAFISTAHIHLDFVGHAAATDRLLTVDPEWTWEPAAFADDGAPLIRREGGEASLWIRLTVAGTTRYGVGIAPANSDELEKKLISDAIRNAAMRFGVALDLWAKEDLSSQHEDEQSVAAPVERPSRRAAAAAASPQSPPAGGAAARSNDIDEMSPPKLMAELKLLGIAPEGNASNWRQQLRDARVNA